MTQLIRFHNRMLSALALVTGFAAMTQTGCLDRGECRDTKQLEVVDPSGAVELRWTEDKVTKLDVYVETSPSMGQAVWSIEAPAGAYLTSGIRYGELPPNAITDFGPTALVRGAKYTATVYSETDEVGTACADVVEFTH